jgi:polyisoprenoid-binding protein YceI
VSLPVKRLRSGNPLQDRELHRRLDARRHPTIDGVVTAIERAGEPGRYRVTGEVTFLGISRPHTDEMAFGVDEDGLLHVEGSSVFDVREFGMEPPRILVLRVEPEVSVRVALVAAQP